jgi:hypothetical protein
MQEFFRPIATISEKAPYLFEVTTNTANEALNSINLDGILERYREKVRFYPMENKEDYLKLMALDAYTAALHRLLDGKFPLPKEGSEEEKRVDEFFRICSGYLPDANCL